MKRMCYLITLISIMFLGGCDTINTEQFNSLQDELDSMEDFDDTILLAEIAALEIEMSSLQDELDSIEDFDDTAMLEEIAVLEAEINLLEAELLLHETIIAKLAVIAPVFSNLPEDQVIQYGDDFDLLSLGLVAFDNIDGDISSNITVNYTDTTELTIGEHSAIYSILDSNGNISTAEITVDVQYADLYYDYITINENTEVSITGYSDSAPKDVVIPNTIGGLPVTSIGAYTFSGDGLTSVTIPDAVTIIGNNAFSQNQLTSVIIPNNVITIGLGAFQNNLLTIVTIPDSVTTIEDWAFNQNQIASATIGLGVTTIGGWAFVNNSLASITIPDNVTVIGTNAFSFNQLTGVTIGNSVTSIGIYAFNQNELTSITIPENVTTIGDNAFINNQFTSVIILGTETRFNSVWEDIGFPLLLKPDIN